jgi:hypothetical protein
MMEIGGNYAFVITGGGELPISLTEFEIVDNTSFQFINTIHLDFSYYRVEFAVNYRYLFTTSYDLPMNAYSLITPFNPQLVYTFPESSTTNYIAPFISGDLLYASSITNRDDDALYCISVFCVEEIQNPRLLASCPVEAPVLKLIVANNHIYAIDNRPRLLVLSYIY